MDIEGTINKIEKIGVGASMQKVARQANLLKLAVSIGIVDHTQVCLDIEDCEEVLKETGRTNLERAITLDIGGGAEWINYTSLSNADNIAQLKEYAQLCASDNGRVELCAIKKRFGVPVVAMFCGGKLVSLSVRYAGRTGASLDIEDRAVRGLPKNIGPTRNNMVKVYGTLSLDSDAETTETTIATELVARVLESNTDGTSFTAEIVDGISCKISDMINWADSVGFGTSDFKVVECFDNEIDSILGEQALELFEYSDNEYIDGIIISINDIERANINNIKKCPMIKIDSDIAGYSYNTIAKGIKLEQEKDDISVWLEIEHIRVNSSEEICKIPVSLDKAYSIGPGDKVTVYKLGDRFEVERRREDE